MNAITIENHSGCDSSHFKCNFNSIFVCRSGLFYYIDIAQLFASQSLQLFCFLVSVVVGNKKRWRKPHRKQNKTKFIKIPLNSLFFVYSCELFYQFTILFKCIHQIYFIFIYLFCVRYLLLKGIFIAFLLKFSLLQFSL